MLFCAGEWLASLPTHILLEYLALQLHIEELAEFLVDLLHGSTPHCALSRMARLQLRVFRKLFYTDFPMVTGGSTAQLWRRRIEFLRFPQR